MRNDNSYSISGATGMLPIPCLCLTFEISEDLRVDDRGNYFEYPDWHDHVLPFLQRRARAIDKLILRDSWTMGLEKRMLVKVASKLTIDHDVAELTQFDLGDRRFVDFLYLYFAHPAHLNGLVQSSDTDFLRDFLRLFPAVYRMDADPTRDLSQLPARLICESKLRMLTRPFRRQHDEVDVDVERQWATLRRILSAVEGTTFLISSLAEGTIWCIFADESVFADLRRDGIITS